MRGALRVRARPLRGAVHCEAVCGLCVLGTQGGKWRRWIRRESADRMTCEDRHVEGAEGAREESERERGRARGRERDSIEGDYREESVEDE